MFVSPLLKPALVIISLQACLAYLAVSSRLVVKISKCSSATSNSIPSFDGHSISLRESPVSSSSLPPLLFIHGSFHSAWCWEETYFPYFLDKGYSCYAISLRGTSDTGLPPDSERRSVKISEHVMDVEAVVQHISHRPSSKVILIAHSFGGVITMKLLENGAIRSLVDTAVLMCSVPPSGNGPMTGRFIRRNIWNAFKIVYGFVLKAATTKKLICRELFFGDEESVSDEDIQRYCI